MMTFSTRIEIADEFSWRGKIFKKYLKTSPTLLYGLINTQNSMTLRDGDDLIKYCYTIFGKLV